jgi:hypothetical protein
MNDLIRSQDFRSVSLKISLLNLDTKVEIADGKRLYKSAEKAAGAHGKQVVHMTEFLEGKPGLVIDAPIDVCGKGHKIRLDITVLNTEPEVRIVVEGEVKKVERSDVMDYWDAEDIKHVQGSQDRVALELTNYSENEWELFKMIFSSRQSEIEDFFKAARGY